MKICARCEVQKNEDAFTKDKTRRDKRSCICKICKSIESKEYNKKNREKLREKCQRWRLANKEKTKIHSKNDREKNKEKIVCRRKTPEAREKILCLVKKWKKQNPERDKENNRNWKRDNKLQCSARLKVMNEIRRGRMMRPTECEKCLKNCKPDAHHEDYCKPLEVQWLCKICHMHKHNKLLDVIT